MLHFKEIISSTSKWNYTRRITSVILLLSILLSLFLSILSFLNVRITLKAELIRNEKNMLQSYITNANNFLEQISSTSTYLSYNTSVIAYGKYGQANPDSSGGSLLDTSRLLLKKDILQAMRVALVSNPYISDIYFYDINSKNILTSSGLEYDEANFFDQFGLQKMKETHAFPLRVDTHFITIDGIQQPVMQYIYRPYGNRDAIIYTVNMKKLYYNIGNTTAVTNKMYMIDKQGKVLMCANPQEILQDVGAIIPGITIPEEESFEVRESKAIAVSIKYADELGWYFVNVSDITEYNKQVIRTFLILLLIFILTIFICAFVAVGISKRLYNPVKELLNLTQTTGKQFCNSKQNEFDFIKAGFKEISSEKERFEDQFNENVRNFRTLFWVDLLQNGGLTKIEIIDKMKSLHIDVPEWNFLVMIVKSLQVHDVDYKQQQIEYFQIVEHFQMIFKGTVVKNTFQVENNLTMVVFYEISYEQVIPLIENAIRTYQSRYDQQLLVTVSDECTQFDKMAESYSMAKAGLRYRIDNHGLILYSEIEKLNKGRYSYPYDMEKALKTQIIAGNSEGANKALEVILDDIFKHSHSAIRISTARLLSVMLELFSVFYQAMKEEVVQGDIQFLEKLDKAEITNYFKTLLEKILIHYENREWVSETAKIIFGEIDKRFTKDVSLEEIADAIGCSTTTISRIVKNVTGMGFVEYLTKKRMDYAEELLTGTALIVSSISEMVGYNDPNYFIRIFKKTYGYTPNKYRMHKKFNKDFQNA